MVPSRSGAHACRNRQQWTSRPGGVLTCADYLRKGYCSGSKLGIFDWRMLSAAGSWSVPAYYNCAKNIRLIAERMARERRAVEASGGGGATTTILPTITPMGATAFSGGRLRSSELFDVTIQLFANGATGLSVFTEQAIDDPGILLAWGEAISIAAGVEDILVNGTVGWDCATVHSGNAVGSSMSLEGRHFVAITPDIVSQWGHASAPPPATVSFSLKADSPSAYELRDLRSPSKPAVRCPAGRCDKQTLTLDSSVGTGGMSAAFLFAPAAS